MGILIALLVIFVWSIHLIYVLFFFIVDFLNPLLYVHILIQGYLYTGLFITAHDAMHGIIAKSKKVNTVFGWIATILFAGLSYKKLIKNHWEHHKNPGTENDPDFYVPSQNFFRWWFAFLWRYATIMQIVIMAVAYNILMIWVPEINLLLLWILPAFIGTFQLFYFGTFVPHKYPHEQNMLPHNARTLQKNHVWAMLSCYFFGYHYEHHESPKTPWWKLYTKK